MIKIVLALASSAIVLTACAPLDPIYMDRRCGHRSVTLTHAADRIVVSRATVPMCGGYSLTVELRPPVRAEQLRSRQARQRNPTEARWLDVDSTDGSSIVIAVPREGISVGQSYKYTLIVDEAGVLDPIIDIIRN